MENNNPNQGNSQMPPPASEPSKGKNIGMAIIAYIIFFVPLLTDAKNDPFVKFHVKQGLVLFIAGLVLSVLDRAPLLHWFTWIFNLALLVLLIIGIVNAAKGQEKQLPLIGKFAENFKF